MRVEHPHKLLFTYDPITVLIHFPKGFQEFLLILVGIQLRSNIRIHDSFELVLELQLIKNLHEKILGSCILLSRFSFILFPSEHFPSIQNLKLIMQLFCPPVFLPASSRSAVWPSSFSCSILALKIIINDYC